MARKRAVLTRSTRISARSSPVFGSSVDGRNPLWAKRWGSAFQQIQKYENAQNRIATSRLIHIARTLNCKINDFIPEEDR